MCGGPPYCVLEHGKMKGSDQTGYSKMEQDSSWRESNQLRFPLCGQPHSGCNGGPPEPRNDAVHKGRSERAGDVINLKIGVTFVRCHECKRASDGEDGEQSPRADPWRECVAVQLESILDLRVHSQSPL